MLAVMKWVLKTSESMKIMINETTVFMAPTPQNLENCFIILTDLIIFSDILR